MIAASLCLLLMALWWRCVTTECPHDTAARTRQCVANLTWGVAPSEDDDNGLNDINGGGHHRDDSFDARGLHQELGRAGPDEMSEEMYVALDYRKIREYCAEDGHMLRFVRCVEELSLRCPDLPPDGVFGQVINPRHVRTSIPGLCSCEDEIESQAECMNSAISQGSTCRERAYNSVSAGRPHPVSHNNTAASFFFQCRFFSVLAECQRTAITETCGGHLGNLHADFLLSFVPSLCNPRDPPARLPQGHGHRGRNGRLIEPGRGSGPTQLAGKDGRHLQGKGAFNIPGKNQGGMDGDRFLQQGTPGGEGHQSPTRMPKIHGRPGTGGSPGELASSDQGVGEKTAAEKATGKGSTIPAPSSSRTHGPDAGAEAQDVTSPEVTSAWEMTSEKDATPTKSHVSYTNLRPSDTSGKGAAVTHRQVFSMSLKLVVSLALLFSV